MCIVVNVFYLVVLENEHVVEQGTPKQLIKQNGVYKRMVDLQKMSYEWKL